MTFGAQLRHWRQQQNVMRSLQVHYDELRGTAGIRFFSICSGIEAASVAWNPIGWKCVGLAEIEKFPSALLAHHYPTVKNHGDFTKIKTRTLGRVDVLCGGTPCQAFSVAGARKSLDDARGNLTLAFVDLAHELVDNNGLRNVVWENVPGVLSTKDNAFGCFLAGLVGASEPFIPTVPAPSAGKSNRWWGWSAKEKRHYIKWPRSGLVTGPKGRAAWSVKDAQYFGLAQRRERVLVVADFGNGADPAAVLFEPEGVRRDSPPSRETGERVAPTISARPTGGGGLGTDFDLDGGLVHAIQAAAMRQNPNSGPDGVGVQADIAYTLEARAEVQAVSYAPSIAPTLRAGGNATGGDRPPGTDVDTCGSLIAYAPPIARCDTTREGSSQDYESTTMVAVGVTDRSSHALKAEGADASEDGTGRGTPIVCVHGTQDPCVSTDTAFALNRNNGRENVICFDPTQITSPANYSSPQPGAPCHPLAAEAHAPVIAFSAKDYGADATHDLSPTLRAGGHNTSHANAGVMPAVAMTVALRGRDGGATAELGGEVATALRASGGGDKAHVLTIPIDMRQASRGATMTNNRPEGSSGGAPGTGVGSDGDPSPTLSTSHPPAVFTTAVRRLTPRECERLQGFQFLVHSSYPGAWQDELGRWWSPDYTAIPWRGKPADQCPDGPRYKTLGNSWAVPKFRWLGMRIAALMPPRR